MDKYRYIVENILEIENTKVPDLAYFGLTTQDRLQYIKSFRNITSDVSHTYFGKKLFYNISSSYFSFAPLYNLNQFILT